jgi:glycosyltransferase involved in cell wall biosynthesis
MRRTYRPDYIAAITWGTLTGARRLASLIRERSVAIVHTNCTHVLSGVIAAKLTGRPDITHVRENILSPRFVSLALARLFWLLTDNMIVVSAGAAREFLGERASHPKVRVIHDGVDLEAFRSDCEPSVARARLGWPEGDLHVGIIARLTPWKGHTVFLEAAARIAKVNRRVQFVIIGDSDTRRNDAYKEQLTALAGRLSVADRMRWTGFVDPVQPLTAALDVVVLPSVRPEPFGRTLVEAMAMRRPVIATNHGGPPEILARGGGILVPPGDAEALASAINELLSDQDRRLRMARIAMEEVAKRFDIASHVNSVVEFYDELLSRSRTSGGATWTSRS